MDNTWNHVQTALEEINVVRGQLAEARATERTVRVYKLVRTRQIQTENGRHSADVLELNAGRVLVTWLHEPKSISLYASIDTARAALCHDDTFRLLLEAVMTRTNVPTPRGEQNTLALTRRERQVVKALRFGLSNKEISQKLGISQHTVHNFLGQAYDKLGVHNRYEAFLFSQNWNLDDPEITDD